MGAALKAIINAFIEDTCVLVAVAYLLARGRMLALLFSARLPVWRAVNLGVAAVRDVGVGMSRASTHQALAPSSEWLHGLQVLTQQLTLLYGQRARLRLFSRAEVGTLAVFAVPNREPSIRHGSA